MAGRRTVVGCGGGRRGVAAGGQAAVGRGARSAAFRVERASRVRGHVRHGGLAATRGSLSTVPVLCEEQGSVINQR